MLAAQEAASLVKARLQCAEAEGHAARLTGRLLAWLGPAAASEAVLAASRRHGGAIGNVQSGASPCLGAHTTARTR